MNSNVTLAKHLGWLTAFSAVLLSSGYLFQNNGTSAVFFVVLILLLLIGLKLLRLHSHSDKQLDTVIKALANNDPTLGLTDSSPIAMKIAEVRTQLQSSRIEAEVQAQFLQSLLLHLDQAILVVDEGAKIIHKNPASDKLVGRIVEDIEQLGELGELIARTNNNLRKVINWHQGERQDSLSVHISCCRIQGKLLKLVSFQSIYQALLAKEQQAYKQLTKVLTHEVANSITPLASLAETAKSLIPEDLSFDEAEDKDDLDEALTTLANRTSQLSTFIKSFNQITSLPKPNLARLDLSELIQQVISLFKQQAQEQDTNINFSDDGHCLLMGDAAQIEQTIINIVKNALEAVKGEERREVSLHLYQKSDQQGRQQLLLDIEDTGPGVAPHVVEQVFVPFFTTKKQGSGIGLSLSRQIMIQHGGDLTYVQRQESGGCFRLSFGLL